MTKTRSLVRRPAPALPPKDLAELRARLMEEQARMSEEYWREMETAQSVQREGLEDFAELASQETDRGRLFAQSEQDFEKLRLIEEALQRMDEGTYGFCQKTAKPIPLERLRQVPWARYLAEVQEKIETGELSERAVKP